MSTVYDPIMRHWPVPCCGEECGQFVVVSFDPVEAVDALEDDTATEAADAMVRTKHLALVISKGSLQSFNEHEQQRLSLEFFLVTNGHGDDVYSIPVGSDGHCHRLSRIRQSVEPSIPLPWSGMQIDTSSKYTAVVSRLDYDEDETYPYLSDAHLRDVVTQSTAQGDAEGHMDDDISEGAGLDDTGYSSDVDGAELSAMYERIADVHPFVEVWADLSVFCNKQQDYAALFSTPSEFAGQVHNLNKITADYERRTISRIVSGSLPGSDDSDGEDEEVSPVSTSVAFTDAASNQINDISTAPDPQYDSDDASFATISTELDTGSEYDGGGNSTGSDDIAVDPKGSCCVSKAASEPSLNLKVFAKSKSVVQRSFTWATKGLFIAKKH
ncbi:hypothetical protein EXIGLDRAFT_846252 [Exidia glandulosa HHB12029]|uniref:Uncharacterized protein n=1 Tax=Exidia glandulosa HHB12029 TaxID=1314781 RepID=A0A165B3B6_EXIGL|nr:hypothetical protein EXIGLDRAFT_846252 [Exidia glandulosa HHB12029]